VRIANPSAKKGVSGEIRYVRNPAGAGDPALTFVTERDEESTMQTRPEREVWIEDMRGKETSLDREGFQLVRHTPATRGLNLIEEDSDADSRYIDEMSGLLTEMTGATLVVMQGGGKKRYGPTAKEKAVARSDAEGT